MTQSAYALFFLLVLLGSGMALFLTIRPSWARIAAALRGQEYQEPYVAEVSAPPSVTIRAEPVLQPVVINICRL